MPELPEVQTIIDGLSPVVIGARIERVIAARKDFIRYGVRQLESGLTGRRIIAIDREGKRIRIHIKGGGLLIIHLGMSGRLTLEPDAQPVQAHTHFRLIFTAGERELRFRDPRRFGGVWFFANGDAAGRNGEARMRPLGPDALSIRVPVLRALARSGRSIKSLLLDQEAISGLGNIYCDESLFAAAIHPLRRASDLSEAEIRRLACSIRSTLRAALKAGGSTLSDYRRSDGSRGLFQNSHRVYGRDRQTCPRCGGLIMRWVVAGRGTHICERCQPAP